MSAHDSLLWLSHLNALAGGLFLLATFGMVTTRQVKGCLGFFILQSVCLCGSAFVLGVHLHSWHVAAVGAIDIINKPVIVPWLLRRTVREEIFSRREVTQVLNIPTSLLIASVLVIVAYVLAMPLVRVADGPGNSVNLPIGLAGLLVGALASCVRREAVPLFLGLLAMENSALLAGFALAPELPMIVELAVIFDVLAIVFIFGVLTRAVHQHIGTTEVGAMALLREESKP
jgi:hydrogenase-4 membrane subunit HyfE